MITGFNTDIEHEGVVYHVQTEDKGLETPVILSLVYVGGAILASKRSPYDDLVGAGFDAAALSERLNRQHKLICAAITAGRIEDLKRLSRNGDGAGAARKGARKSAKAQTPPAAEAPGGPAAETTPAAEVPPLSSQAELSAEVSAQTEVPTEADAPAPSNGDAPRQAPAEGAKSELPSWLETGPESYASVLEKVAASEAAEEVVNTETAEAEQSRRLPPKEAVVASGVSRPSAEVAGEAAPPSDAGTAEAPSGTAPQPDTGEIISVEVDGELHVSLMEERDYRAGEIVTLRVRVSRGPLEAREGVSDATITVKILGTEFRPLILTSKTDRDGVAVIHAWLPRFTSGRAAILVRAAHDGFTAELRRAIRHA